SKRTLIKSATWLDSTSTLSKRFAPGNSQQDIYVSHASLFLTRADVRAIDQRAEKAGLPTRVLMENAGRGAAEVAMRLGIRGPVLVCAGKGNNGGDGLVAARHLASCGVSVRVLLFASP